jgi:hypothetical protein
MKGNYTQSNKFFMNEMVSGTNRILSGKNTRVNRKERGGGRKEIIHCRKNLSFPEVTHMILKNKLSSSTSV